MNEAVQTWRAIFTPDRLRRGEILELRDRRLRRLVAHAYENVAHYRRLMDRHGILPGDIRTAEDLRRFPVTTRDELQSAPARDTTAKFLDPDRLRSSRTSGSTGAPLLVRRTPHEIRMEHVRWFGMLRGYGLGPFDRRATVRTLHREGEGLLQIEKRRFLYPHLCLHCGLEPADILRRLRAYRPEILASYAGTLALLASHVSDSDRDAIRPRIVFSGSEVLDPIMRRRVEQAFQAPVYEVYATIEHNLIGLQCKPTGEFHVRDDDVILEVVTGGRPAREGEQGEAYVTNLHAFSMPFLRFRLGDIVTMGRDQCSCGAPFSTIRRVEGRVLDRLLLPDGRFVHPYDILHSMEACVPRIRQYQLVQESEHDLTMRVALVSPFDESTRRQYQDAVSQLLGPGVDFRIETVERILPGPGGKYHLCVSRVNPREPSS